MIVVKEKDRDSVDTAIQYLSNGKIICFATDTVYGVAVDASNEVAVNNLYNLKGRSLSKPIAIFVKDFEYAKKIFQFSNLAEEIVKKYMPGAITAILKTSCEGKKILAKNLNSNDNDFIGFRIIDSYFVKKLFEKYRGALAVSSANKAGEDPCHSAHMVKKKLKDIDLLITGNNTGKIASTIVKIDENELTILRQGQLNIKPYEY